MSMNTDSPVVVIRNEDVASVSMLSVHGKNKKNS